MENLQVHNTSPRHYNDIKSPTGILSNLVQHDIMKDMRIDYSFIKKREIEEGGIELSYIHTTLTTS